MGRCSSWTLDWADTAAGRLWQQPSAVTDCLDRRDLERAFSGHDDVYDGYISTRGGLRTMELGAGEP